MRRHVILASVLIIGACSSGSNSSDVPTTTESASTPSTETTTETTAPPDELLPLDLNDPFTPDRNPLSEPGVALLEAPTDESFWEPPTPLPGKPGDLIWVRPAMTLPNGEIYLVLYHSSDTFGRSVGVTGWLAVPNEISADTPVFSWGHGTTGMADDCAPTRESTPDKIPFIERLLDRGLVVAATDYAYLGTPGPHPYFDASTMAFSMIDAAIAAQRFTGARGPTFFGGYSIGGRGSVFAQSLAPAYAPDLEVAGTAIFRPGVDGSGNNNAYRLLRDSPLKGYAVMAFYGVNLAWGNDYFDLEKYLTPEALELLPLLDADCRDSVLEAFRSMRGDDVFLISQTDELPGRSADGSKQISDKPLLISAGVVDSTIGRSAIDAYLADACANGQEIELHWLMQEHGLSADEDGPLLIDWIDRVLSGNSINNCSGGVSYPPLCPGDLNVCSQVNISNDVEGDLVNPFASVPGTNWQVLAETTTASVCPGPTYACTGEIFDGHITRIVKSDLAIDVSDAEAWITESFWESVDGFWTVALRRTVDHPCNREGFYFEVLARNQLGLFVITPHEQGSTIYGLLSHNNRTTLPDYGVAIKLSGEWPCR